MYSSRSAFEAVLRWASYGSDVHFFPLRNHYCTSARSCTLCSFRFEVDYRMPSVGFAGDGWVMYGVQLSRALQTHGDFLESPGQFFRSGVP